MKKFPNTAWDNLGQRIANIRHSKGISQLGLAEMSDISKEHLSNLERGKKLPSAKTLAQIANALEVPMEILIGIDSYQAQLEIDSKLQDLLQGYSFLEKEIILDIICRINQLCNTINKT